MLVIVAVFVCVLNRLFISPPQKKITIFFKIQKLVYSFIFRARVALTQYFAVDRIDVLTELFFLFFGRFLDLA